MNLARVLLICVLRSVTMLEYILKNEIETMKKNVSLSHF